MAVSMAPISSDNHHTYSSTAIPSGVRTSPKSHTLGECADVPPGGGRFALALGQRDMIQDARLLDGLFSSQ